MTTETALSQRFTELGVQPTDAKLGMVEQGLVMVTSDRTACCWFFMWDTPWRRVLKVLEVVDK